MAIVCSLARMSFLFLRSAIQAMLNIGVSRCTHNVVTFSDNAVEWTRRGSMADIMLRIIEGRFIPVVDGEPLDSLHEL